MPSDNTIIFLSFLQLILLMIQTILNYKCYKINVRLESSNMGHPPIRLDTAAWTGGYDGKKMKWSGNQSIFLNIDSDFEDNQFSEEKRKICQLLIG